MTGRASIRRRGLVAEVVLKNRQKHWNLLSNLLAPALTAYSILERLNDEENQNRKIPSHPPDGSAHAELGARRGIHLEMSCLEELGDMDGSMSFEALLKKNHYWNARHKT